MILNYLSAMWMAIAAALGNHLWQSTLFAGRFIDLDFTKESGPRSLLALAGRVGEISNPLISVGRPLTLVLRFGRGASSGVRCD